MATACALITAQRIALGGVFAGIVSNCFLKIVTDPNFHEYRKNRVLYATLLIGSASCVVTSFTNLAIQIPEYKTSQTYFTSALCWIISSFTFYSILFERAVAVVRGFSIVSPKTLQVIRHIGPIVLVIPHMIYSVYVFDLRLGSNDARSALTNVGTIIFVIANFVFSVSFIHTLAANRSESISKFIRNRKYEAGNLLSNTFVSFALIIIKIASFTIPLPEQHPLFGAFHNLISALVMINLFKDYIFVTRQVSKEILSTKITCSAGVA